MALTKEQRAEVLKANQRSSMDTGSSEVQVALLTARINSITDHFVAHKKDMHGRLGLIKMVSRRRKLLDYLKRTNVEKYKKLIQTLDIRK